MHPGSSEDPPSSPEGDTGASPEARNRALARDLGAYIDGDDEAANRICRLLEPTIRAEVARFLPASDPDRDDVMQETLLALLGYLRRTRTCPERPEAFVVTMTGNRCRNLYQWRKRRPSVELDSAHELPSDRNDDPLRRLERAELEGLLRRAFHRLDAPCRGLLRSIYLEERPMEQLQREAGLTTVQGVYYRKYVCLRKLSELLNGDWFGGHQTGAKP
jgi:RNA polymerase sigma factor (sigma-70 family)